VKNWEDVKMALSLTFEYLWVGFDNMVLKIGYAAAWLSREWNEMLSAILKAAEPIISILPERWQAAFTEMRQAVAFAADRAEADMSRLADAVERNVARVNVAVWQLQQTQAQAAERSQVMARGLRAVREQGSQAAKTVDEAA